MAVPIRRSFMARAWQGLVMTVLALPGGHSAAAQGAAYQAGDQAPASWTQFAQLVKVRFEEWVAADDEVAGRFRSYVKDRAGQAGGPPASVVVRAWVNPDGSVERVSFPPLPDARADADLRTILQRGNVGGAPPPEMLQPLNLRFAIGTGP
ncbi:hypothetical protein PQJ75_24870 [Rhodoplanes sp. TEM]|uniref:YbaB/EbfC family DNA-binding protein n=1 Tax=Rhodoplanes tepidamans TaxID=200616 RepID=A0ABT5JBF5_RHOTP|nr:MULTISPECIES: hypothetical protein [Rhodoplanes]MDC7787014.1 hypothetical protein [Rhodoplanes tepidamans]MDC7986976.1 hypothetical protein [Rhodoplanes sp. TEM]MDQ0354261.1 hypothetical protein [Rhodoplanes tepidamans]